MWSQEIGEELSLYPFIRKEAGNCVKTTGISLLSIPGKVFASTQQLSANGDRRQGNGRASRVPGRQRACRAEVWDEAVGREDD